jgi:AcrR family transcriptional regulator
VRATQRRRISAEERRGRILDGALQVFARRGYEGASMVAIAEAGGITPAVIYDHFASKAELHVTLLEAQADELMSAVGTALAEGPDTLGGRMRAGVDAFFAFVEQRGFAWWLLFRDPPSDPAIAEVYGRIQSEATAGIAGMLREWAPPGLLDQPHAERDLEMFAQLLRTAQNGLAAWWYEHPDTPREALVDRVMEFAWLGLERVASGERHAPRGSSPSRR